jgi:hypothetical protein
MRLEGVPVRVAAGGAGLADAGIAVADADGAFFPDGVGEFGEASVLSGCDVGCLFAGGRCGDADGDGVPDERGQRRGEVSLASAYASFEATP